MSLIQSSFVLALLSALVFVRSWGYPLASGFWAGLAAIFASIWLHEVASTRIKLPKWTGWVTVGMISVAWLYYFIGPDLSEFFGAAALPVLPFMGLYGIQVFLRLILNDSH